MNRDNDDELVEYLVSSCKSLEVLKYIKFLGYEFNSDESKIDINDYITTRKKSKKKDTTKFMYLQDSRFGELKLKFQITCKGETVTKVKKLLVPIADENGYYTIKGKKYFLSYQLVDASTYTSRKNLTLKSLMPVTLKRVESNIKDTNDNNYTAPSYVVFIFRKEVDVLLFYFAKIGVKRTLEYFSVNNVIKIKTEIENTKDNIYFNINKKIFIEVNRYFFQKYQYVQSIVCMILNNCNNRITMENIEDKNFWVEKIGSFSTTNQYNFRDKGESTLTFFDRMLDETTRKILKVHPENKKNIYSVLKWMIQNFNELKKKDNLDLENKRLRCNEYIASLLTKAFSERLNRVISLGSRVTLEQIVKQIFKFPGDLLMQQLYKSGLLRFDDKINDMDFFSKFKFTLKGGYALVLLIAGMSVDEHYLDDKSGCLRALTTKFI
jgi:hypothetical protein